MLYNFFVSIMHFINIKYKIILLFIFLTMDEEIGTQTLIFFVSTICIQFWETFYKKKGKTRNKK